mmetsp:Transcript_54179/g.115664  ORF Transcript_54179/g.115664 Transcript_54179/m.115664 type:complete len:298 (-) Transcript_54179:239-1132(-)
MGGEDGYDGLVPFETIVQKGTLVKEIEERKQALVEKCKSNSGLTLQEVIDHNDWLLQVERDLSKARARIERDFRISNALSLKVREGKRKAQLQQRLDVLRSQCDVLNECIHGLSDHCAWFQESGTYREAADLLEGRWDDEDVDDTHYELRKEHGSGAHWDGSEDAVHHDLEGLIHGGGAGASGEKRRRKKRRSKKAMTQEKELDGACEEEEDEEDEVIDIPAEGEAHPSSAALSMSGSGPPSFSATRRLDAFETSAAAAAAAAAPGAAATGLRPDFRWLRLAGNADTSNCVDVWAPD